MIKRKSLKTKKRRRVLSSCPKTTKKIKERKFKKEIECERVKSFKYIEDYVTLTVGLVRATSTLSSKICCTWTSDLLGFTGYNKVLAEN